MTVGSPALSPTDPAADGIALRPPATVMRLARMGSAFPTRLSFMPTLIRRLACVGSRIERRRFDLDADGYGCAVYAVSLGGFTYSLVTFSQHLDPHRRTDRVIAEAWDATFVLFDGVPGDDDLSRLAAEVPRQEAGRFLASELVLSRANRSVRMFDHVVDALAAGRQPDPAQVQAVGYLMRTTAVYGNGKFGIADRDRIAGRTGLSGPFAAEMLTVYLIRCFTHDLVEHVAHARDPERAVRLSPPVRRHLGIGNATGLGMAPFLVSHPLLIHNWVAARETALARVRGRGGTQAGRLDRFRAILARARAHAAEWSVEDPVQMARIEGVRRDLERLAEHVRPGSAWISAASAGDGGRPWDDLYRWGEQQVSLEGQELLVALLLEPQGDLVDDLADRMATDDRMRLDPAMPLGTLAAIVRHHYAWALAIDFAAPGALHQFWYVSEEKLEPRLGLRAEEPGAELEMPLGVARDVQALAAALDDADQGQCVAAFLPRRPDLRHIVRRVQSVARHPYGEIHDNLLAADCLPIDLLRCKLAFFGAAKFDPRSHRWTRITLYQGAPLPEDLSGPLADDWCFPALAGSGCPA